MLGVDLEHLRLESPVFVYLRAHLDIVAVYVCSGKRFVGSACEHTLKGVSELMECCLNLVDREQGGIAAGRPGEVADVVDDRTFC